LTTTTGTFGAKFANASEILFYSLKNTRLQRLEVIDCNLVPRTSVWDFFYGSLINVTPYTKLVDLLCALRLINAFHEFYNQYSMLTVRVSHSRPTIDRFRRLATFAAL
jgi:hypothetical protein